MRGDLMHIRVQCSQMYLCQQDMLINPITTSDCSLWPIESDGMIAAAGIRGRYNNLSIFDIYCSRPSHCMSPLISNDKLRDTNQQIQYLVEHQQSFRDWNCKTRSEYSPNIQQIHRAKCTVRNSSSASPDLWISSTCIIGKAFLITGCWWGKQPDQSCCKQ